MIRARFKANLHDCRPIKWPIKHPYWRTGEGDTYSIIVAYADDIAEIKTNWPEAEDIEADEVTGYEFGGRFPRPSWFK